MGLLIMKFFYKRLHGKKGFTVVELLVAMIVFSLLMLAVMMLFNPAITAITGTRRNTRADTIAEAPGDYIKRVTDTTERLGIYKLGDLNSGTACFVKGCDHLSGTCSNDFLHFFDSTPSPTLNPMGHQINALFISQRGNFNANANLCVCNPAVAGTPGGRIRDLGTVNSVADITGAIANDNFIFLEPFYDNLFLTMTFTSLNGGLTIATDLQRCNHRVAAPRFDAATRTRISSFVFMRQGVNTELSPGSLDLNGGVLVDPPQISNLTDGVVILYTRF